MFLINSTEGMTQFDLQLDWVALGHRACVAGRRFSLAGHWRDRDRMVELGQLGPWGGKNVKSLEAFNAIREKSGWALILERRDLESSIYCSSVNAVQENPLKGRSRFA